MCLSSSFVMLFWHICFVIRVAFLQNGKNSCSKFSTVTQCSVFIILKTCGRWVFCASRKRNSHRRKTCLGQIQVWQGVRDFWGNVGLEVIHEFNISLKSFGTLVPIQLPRNESTDRSYKVAVRYIRICTMTWQLVSYSNEHHKIWCQQYITKR